jgi:glycogen phosphorylase
VAAGVRSGRGGWDVAGPAAAGEENFFLFGLTAEQVANSRGWYDPRWHVEHEPETRRALELIRSGAFDRGEPGVFTPILDTLLAHGDYYMHLADLTSYVKTQEQVSALYQQPDAWARKAILNVGHSGTFSSDRTIAEYAAAIWGAEPCPVG